MISFRIDELIRFNRCRADLVSRLFREFLICTTEKQTMIPVNIQDIIRKATDKTTTLNARQFYYDTLVKVNKATGQAIELYEAERDNRR